VIHYDRYVTRMLVGLGPLLAASCLGEAYLEGVKLFPDGEASSSGSDADSTSTTADLPTTNPDDTGIQTATGALDEDSTTGTGTEPGPGTSTGSESTAGEVDNQPPVIDEFGASAYFFDAAGPLTLTLAAHDDQAVVKVRLYLDEEEIESDLTLADFPYVYDLLSAKYNGNERRFKVEVHDAEGLTAAAETMPITITLPESGAERCIFEDPDKGTVLSVISAIEYTPEAIFAVGTRALKMAIWKLDADNCSPLPGWPKTIVNWTGDNTFKGLTSLGTAVDEDEDGNIVVGGNFLVNGKPQAYVALLTDDGARLWERAGSPGDELAGVAAGLYQHHNKVFVGGAVYTNDNPVRTDAAVWIYHFDGDTVFVAPPATLRAPFTLDEDDLDEMNVRSERVRAIVAQPGTGYALAVGERELRPNGDVKVYNRSFTTRVQPTGGLVGTPWTSTAEASFVHDAARSVAACGDGFLAGGWTRDVPADAEPSPVIFWFEDDGTMKQRRSEPQMASTRILGIACDPENKVVSAGTREAGADDARVFTVLGLFDPKITYDDGVAGDDAAGAVACDPRGFCGWGGYRTMNGIPYAVVRVHHP
jgi:hypothetical protein